MSAAGDRRAPDVPLEPQTVEVELTGMGRGGEATGCLDGQKVFAAFGLPGERVELDVWERRSDRLWGRVVRVLRPSPHRVAPRCPYFGTCGGCQWQHVDYQHQLDLKTEMVATHLAEGAGFANPPVLPTLPSPAVYGYRNHARFSIGRRHGELGFTTHFGHRFMRVDHCPIMSPRIDEVLTATQGRARGHQLAVRVGVQTGDLLVNPAQEDPHLPYESGQAWLEEELLGRRYRVSAAAFFQINTCQAERMIEVVRAAVEPGPDDVVLDLYCGVGTFGLALAPYVRRVIGVEESRAITRATSPTWRLWRAAPRRFLRDWPSRPPRRLWTRRASAVDRTRSRRSCSWRRAGWSTSPATPPRWRATCACSPTAASPCARCSPSTCSRRHTTWRPSRCSHVASSR